MRILKKASSNDPTPTPGYLYKEIADMTQVSYEQSERVSKFLFERLEHTSPHVKAKVLRIIKNTAIMGHPDFKKLASMRSEALRKSASFHGPQHPLHGDEYNIAVREAAKEAIVAVFDTSNTTSNSSNRSRMQGFSNPNYEAPIAQPNSTQKASVWNKVSGILPSGRKKEQQAFTHGAGGFERFERMREAQKMQNDSSDGATLPNSNIFIPGGFELGDTTNESTFVPPTIPTSSTHQRDSASSNSDLPKQTQHEEKRKSSPSPQMKAVSHEERFVNDMTSPSGVHTSPPRSLVEAFCRRARRMDTSEIADLLNEKLMSLKWQTRLKALYFVEGLIKQGNQPVIDFFAENADNLVQIQHSSRSSVEKKAKSILKLVNREDLVGVSATSSPAAQDNDNALPDSYNFIQEEPSTDSTLVDIGSTDTAATMFEGLDITDKSPAKTSTKNQSFDPSTFWDTDSSAQSPDLANNGQQANVASTTTPDDIFSFFDSNTTSTSVSSNANIAQHSGNTGALSIRSKMNGTNFSHPIPSMEKKHANHFVTEGYLHAGAGSNPNYHKSQFAGHPQNYSGQPTQSFPTSQAPPKKQSEFSFLDAASDESDGENAPDRAISEMLQQEFARSRKK